ncbi:hypothetical protein [Paenibacillus sp. FSL H3-0286]|uniref:hypothetical protein n=1 Tax=Paenibacillus sp. FSL H3-0286 TaxID=2921427 RepID=UPI003249B416
MQEPRYKRKSPQYVSAIQFLEGMEDGYSCYEIFTNKWIGWFDKDGLIPKTNRTPYIYNSHGDVEEHRYGDYIVTYEDKSKKWICKELFERDYELIED